MWEERWWREERDTGRKVMIKDGRKRTLKARKGGEGRRMVNEGARQKERRKGVMKGNDGGQQVGRKRGKEGLEETKEIEREEKWLQGEKEGRERG